MFRRTLLKILATLPAVDSASATNNELLKNYSEDEAKSIGNNIEEEVIAASDSQVIEATRTAPLRVQLTCSQLPSKTIKQVKNRGDLQLGPITSNPRTGLYSFSILKKSHPLEVVHRQDIAENRPEI